VIQNHGGVGDSPKIRTGSRVAGNGRCPGEGTLHPKLYWNAEQDVLRVEIYHSHGNYRPERVGLRIVIFHKEKSHDYAGFEFKGVVEWWKAHNPERGKLLLSTILRVLATYEGTPIIKRQIENPILFWLNFHNLDTEILIS
jgi:hypothetical protein